MHKRITGYCLIEKKKADELSGTVDALLREGWQPVGRIIYADSKYMQVVVRYKEFLNS